MTSREVARVPQRQEELTLSPNRQSQGEPTMKTTTTQQQKTVLGVLLLAALAMTGANAAILHSIPGGDCTTLPDAIVSTVSDQSGSAAGWWSTYTGWSGGDVVKATGTGAARHLELSTGWYVEDAAVWYTDYGTTPANAAWNISSDLKWAGGATNTLSMVLYADQDGTQASFGVYFTGQSVSWTAGSQTGTFSSATGLDNSWRTLSVVYSPLTGQAVATLGAEQLFTVNAGTGLLVKRVQLQDHAPSYGNSTFSIDNITANPVPEPVALGLLALGMLGVLRRRR